MKPSFRPGLSLRRRSWCCFFFAQALDLADQFDDDPQFSGALLSAVISRRGMRAGARDNRSRHPARTGQRPAGRAFAALASHAERHGDASPFKVIQAPEDPEELLAKMTELVRRDHGPLLGVLEMIRQGRAPLGVLSTMLRHPYSSTLAQRGLPGTSSPRLATTPTTRPTSAAAAARNGDVVADISRCWSRRWSANSTTRAGSSGPCSRRQPAATTSPRDAASWTDGPRAAASCPMTL